MNLKKDFIFIIQLILGSFAICCIYQDAILLGFAAMMLAYILAFISERLTY